MNQESEKQVRPISFFLIMQKSVKNGTKNTLKKLTFTTLRPTHESFTLPILLLLSSREAGCEYKLFSSFG